MSAKDADTSLAKLGADKRATLEKVREAICAAAPDAEAFQTSDQQRSLLRPDADRGALWEDALKRAQECESRLSSWNVRFSIFAPTSGTPPPDPEQPHMRTLHPSPVSP